MKWFRPFSVRNSLFVVSLAWFASLLWCWFSVPVLVLTCSLFCVWALAVCAWLGLMLNCILLFFSRPGRSVPLWSSPHCYVWTSLLLFKGFSALKLWLSLELLCTRVTLAACELWHALSVIDLNIQYVQQPLFSLCLNCVFPESVIFFRLPLVILDPGSDSCVALQWCLSFCHHPLALLPCERTWHLLTWV